MIYKIQIIYSTKHKIFLFLNLSMNKNTWYLFPIELYIIIAVRNIRFELGISGEDISDILKKMKNISDTWKALRTIQNTMMRF